MQYPAWVCQPFSYDTITADINSPYTDDIIELQKRRLKNVNSTQQIFKCFGANKSKVILLLLKLPLRFSCHSSPFIHVNICFLFWWMLKQKSETGLHAKIRIVVSKTKPQISQLVTKKQQQKTH